MKIQNAFHVAACRLCLGCGACFSVCPEQRIKLFDYESDGIRPIIQNGNCQGCDICLKACPGISTSMSANNLNGGKAEKKLTKKWGNLKEVWEGFASDPEIRFKGSSGGLCTVLSIFCLENDIAGGVLHIGGDSITPWKNKTFRSTTKEELVSRTGSRYAPASPCDSLKLIEDANDQSVFIGKPCDVAGLRMAQKLRLKLAEKTALAIGFFCAGTPSTQGTIDLLKAQGIDYQSLSDLKYRGDGWPGMATAKVKGDSANAMELSYMGSWGFVQKYRPFRCYLCPDLTAEFADISVGDPWYREVGENEPGRSLILIRTEKGRDIFHRAMEQGYVTAERADPEIIYQSQKNLLGKRQAIWGRILAMKMMRIPYPKLEGFHLFENWLDLSLKEKFRSIFGTFRRIIQRKYYRPLKYFKNDQP